mmetsp:Transcript_527/g.598  ORF Transcript_527/g.598 Transcript_527/m.598 type:complete len:300 (-) Transcript_527:14-913(-)
MAQKIGWIGTGVMGRYMAEHLMKAGHSLSVFNRTKAKAQPLIDQGAEYGTAHEVAKSSDVLFLMVGYPKDVETLVLGDNGILKAMKPGSILIDHTTSSPSLSEQIYQEGKTLGIECLDAPVSGGDIGAQKGTLVSMIGGDRETLDKVNPLLETFSANIKYAGGAGKGQHTKMANQIVISQNMNGVAEALIYAHKMGLDLEETIKTLTGGAANSFSLSVLGPRILKRDFDPGFYVEHFVKDMEIALEEARRANLSLPGLAYSHQLYKSLEAHGGSKYGTQAIALALERMNNVDLTKPNDN